MKSEHMKALEEIRGRRERRMGRNFDEENWVTVNGTHICVEEGTVTKGPPALKEHFNKNAAKSPSGSKTSEKANDKAAASSEPKSGSKPSVPKSTEEYKKSLENSTWNHFYNMPQKKVQEMKRNSPEYMAYLKRQHPEEYKKLTQQETSGQKTPKGNVEYTEESFKSGEWNEQARNAKVEDYRKLGEYTVGKSGSTILVARNSQGYALASAADIDTLRRNVRDKIDREGQMVGMKSGEKRTFSAKKMTDLNMKHFLKNAAYCSTIVSKDGTVYTKNKDDTWSYKMKSSPTSNTRKWGMERRTAPDLLPDVKSIDKITMIRK